MLQRLLHHLLIRGRPRNFRGYPQQAAAGLQADELGSHLAQPALFERACWGRLVALERMVLGGQPAVLY